MKPRETSVETRGHATNGKRRRGGFRRLPSIRVLPTLCTLGNLLAGFAALFYATKGPEFAGPYGWSGLTMAGALIFLGMVFDAVDGSLARLTGSASDLGGQLDSLSDMVTFGAVPAFVTLMLANEYLAADEGMIVLGPGADNILGKIIWGTAAIYVACTALRLARFNVEVGPDASEHRIFHGLPSPGAAGMVASLVILHQHMLGANYASDVPPGFAKTAALSIPFIMLLCAFAMVSSIPYVHVTNRFIHGSRSFTYVVSLAIVFFGSIWFFQEVLAATFTVYVLSGPLMLPFKPADPEA